MEVVRTKFLKEQTILVWISYSILSIVNFVYLREIIKLQVKAFHLMMFVILQICYFSYIIEYVLWYEFGLTKYQLVTIFTDIWSAMLILAHSIFVIKYLIISLKISETLTGIEDKYLAIKVWLVVIIQTLLIGLSFVPFPNADILKYST